MLEGEINRLRAKAGLPRVRLVPEAAQPNPAPKPDEAPKGAGKPLDLGGLLPSLRAQVVSSAAELEATALAIHNPLPTDPSPGRIVRRPQAPVLTRVPQATRLSVHGARTVPKGIIRDAAQFVPAGLPLLAEIQILRFRLSLQSF